jgi:hypothetical protein
MNRRRGWLLGLDSGALLGPADLLSRDEGDDDERTLEVWGQSIPLSVEGVTVEGGLALRTIEADAFKAEHPWPIAKIHFGADLSGDYPEVIVTCGSDNLTMPLTADRLTAEDGQWRVDPGFPLDETWHGACVMSAKEGKLLGFVLQGEDSMLVVPIDRKLFGSGAQ